MRSRGAPCGGDQPRPSTYRTCRFLIDGALQGFWETAMQVHSEPSAPVAAVVALKAKRPRLAAPPPAGPGATLFEEFRSIKPTPT